MTDYSKWDRFVSAVSDSDDEDEASTAKPQPPQKKSNAQQSGSSGPRAEDAAATLERLQRTELLGEGVLTDRQQMVELDRQRNKNREALAALRRIDRQGAEAAAAQKHWLYQGAAFTRHTQVEARAMLEADQARLDAEIERLRGEVKRKTSLLCELDPSMCAGRVHTHSRPRSECLFSDAGPLLPALPAQCGRLRHPPSLCRSARRLTSAKP